jgi:hypothetical protein
MGRVKAELTGFEASPRHNHLRISELVGPLVGNAGAYIKQERAEDESEKIMIGE